MNPSNPSRLTVVEIREPLTRLEVEYRIYQEAAERYHSHTQTILKDVLELLSKARLKESLAATQTDTAQQKSDVDKSNGRKSTVASDTLTKREIQVLSLIATGNSTKQVASVLGITFKTAVGHRSSLMKKLSIHNTAILVRFAIHSGLIDA